MSSSTPPDTLSSINVGEIGRFSDEATKSSSSTPSLVKAVVNTESITSVESSLCAARVEQDLHFTLERSAHWVISVSSYIYPFFYGIHPNSLDR